MRTYYTVFITLIMVLPLKIMMSQKLENKNQTSSEKWLHATFPNQVVYQVFTRSFADGNGDGKGDLNGIRKKLPYLKDLGIGAIWLTPIFESPTYHKYDITNYYAIDPECGTLAELKQLVEEAHKVNIKIILDFVANHTSSEHEWFKESAKGNAAYKNYYYWSSDRTLWNKEPEHWHWLDDHAKGSEKYYGYFWRGMPDLNYDNNIVRSQIIESAIYWIKECNIDGYRLDAASHIYPYAERNKNYEWWKQFSTTLRKVKPDFYIVGEMWGGDTLIAPYLKAGLNAGFNFDCWFNIKASLKEEKDLMTTKLLEAYKNYDRHNPMFSDALILSNHDNPRIMDEVEGNIDKAKQAAAILFTLPYTPYLYYGDELGMYGPKPDEHIREPFLWQTNDEANSTWEPNYHNKTTARLSEQIADTNSIYHVYKNLIHLRNSDEVLANGMLTLSLIHKDGFLMYGREIGNKKYLIIHNLKNLESGIDLSLLSTKNGIEKIISLNHISRLQAYQLFIPAFGSVMVAYEMP